jgi:hypothetical protein
LPLPYAGEDGAQRQVRGSTAHPSSCHYQPAIHRRRDPDKASAQPHLRSHFSINPASSGALPDEGTSCRPNKIRSRSVAGRNPSVGARSAWALGAGCTRYGVTMMTSSDSPPLEVVGLEQRPDHRHFANPKLTAGNDVQYPLRAAKADIDRMRAIPVP